MKINLKLSEVLVLIATGIKNGNTKTVLDFIENDLIPKALAKEKAEEDSDE